LIRPKLQLYNALIKDHKILQALLKLNVQNDEEFEMLSDKYKNLLHNKQSIEESFERESTKLDRLIGIVTDFYVDWNKFKGINVKNKLEKLAKALRDCSSETLFEMFDVGSENKSENKVEE
jgi:Bardet-Biedl syndrome 7 protein